jgi:hypothetical protein
MSCVGTLRRSVLRAQAHGDLKGSDEHIYWPFGERNAARENLRQRTVSGLG